MYRSGVDVSFKADEWADNIITNAAIIESKLRAEMPQPVETKEPQPTYKSSERH